MIWISVEKDLPKLIKPIEVSPITDRCIVRYGTEDDPCVKVAMYDHKDKRWLNKWNEEVYNITHWMLYKSPEQE